jgi:DNA-binding transcriptional LysR family regulator
VAAGIGYSLVPALAPGGPQRPGVVARPLAVEVSFPVLALWRASAASNPAIVAAVAALSAAPRG